MTEKESDKRPYEAWAWAVQAGEASRYVEQIAPVLDFLAAFDESCENRECSCCSTWAGLIREFFDKLDTIGNGSYQSFEES